jgi:hypothetical protein
MKKYEQNGVLIQLCVKFQSQDDQTRYTRKAESKIQELIATEKSYVQVSVLAMYVCKSWNYYVEFLWWVEL